MRHGRCLFAATVVFCSFAISSSGDEQVAEFGDFSQIKFRGESTYSADKLREAMRLSNDVQFAAHPTAPLSKFLSAIESFVSQGYRNGGFSEPVVRAQVDRQLGLVVVEVREGPRFRQGEIRINGGEGLPVESIRQCLLGSKSGSNRHLTIRAEGDDQEQPSHVGEKPSSDGAAKWSQGEYVRFDRRLNSRWRKQLETHLLDLGRIDAKIDFEIQLKPESKTADLMVNVLDIGRQIRAERIMVSGLERNSSQQLLDYVDVEQGMPLDAATIARIEDRLYQAARFVTYDVSLVRQDSDGTVALTIEAMEIPGAPRLNEEFDAHQMALLRVGRWLDEWQEHAGYLQCHLECEVPQVGGNATLDFVVSPRQGLTGSLSARFAERRLQYAVAATRARTAVFNAERQRCYLHPPFPLARFDMNLGLSQADGEIKSNLKFGAHTSSELKQDAPISFRIKCAPGLAVHRATSDETHWVEQENGLTTVEFKTSTMTFDAKTGRVHRLVERSQEQFEFRLEFATDETTAPQEDFASRYIGLMDVYQADYPLASFVGFVVGEVLWNAQAGREDHERLSRRTDVLGQLVARQLGPALEAFADRKVEKDEESFQGPGIVSVPVTTDYRAVLAACGPALADKLFPRRSWPWIVLREAAFVAQGRSTYTMDEVRFLLQDPRVGPVGCAVLAKAMSYVKATELSQRFASQGIDRLTRDALRRDLALFTAGDKSAPKLIAVIVDLFRGLTAEEIAAVCELLGKPKVSKQMQNLHLVLAFDSRPSNQLIASRVETFWDIAIKPRLEKALRQHLPDRESATRPPQKPSGPLDQ